MIIFFSLCFFCQLIFLVEYVEDAILFRASTDMARAFFPGLSEAILSFAALFDVYGSITVWNSQYSPICMYIFLELLYVSLMYSWEPNSTYRRWAQTTRNIVPTACGAKDLSLCALSDSSCLDRLTWLFLFSTNLNRLVYLFVELCPEILEFGYSLGKLVLQLQFLVS